MWLFKKNTSPDQLPIDGPWSVGEGENDGKVMIVRANTGYREFGSLPGYEHQAGIAVPFRAPEPTGLPSWDENAQLDDFGRDGVLLRQAVQQIIQFDDILRPGIAYHVGVIG